MVKNDTNDTYGMVWYGTVCYKYQPLYVKTEARTLLRRRLVITTILAPSPLPEKG